MKKKKKPSNNLNKSIWDKNKDLPKKRHEAGSPLYVIIDGFNFAHAAKHAYKSLSFKGKSVSVLFGMPQMIRSTIIKNGWKPQQIIIAWDGDKSQRRMKWLPEYKMHREEKRDPVERAKFIEQIVKVQKLFYYMGITQAYDPKMEGDDMIYHLAKRYSKLSRVMIVSGDKDMLQLINYDVSVYNQRNDMLYDPEGFTMSHWGLRVSQFLDFQILCGDTSDDIPGYPGIGEKRGAQFLMLHNSIADYLEDEDAEFSGMIDKDKVASVYKLGRRMMNLSWYNEKYHPNYQIPYYRNETNPSLQLEKYLHQCAKRNMQTLMKSPFLDWVKNTLQ